MMGRTITGLLLLVAGALCLDCSPSDETPSAKKPTKVAGSAKAEVLKVTDANFDAVVLQSKIPVLVDFWTTWCGPCKLQAPIVEELAGLYSGRAVMAKLDCDDNKRTARKYEIKGLPTLLIFKNGKVAKKFVGLTSKKVLAGALDASLR